MFLLVLLVVLAAAAAAIQVPIDDTEVRSCLSSDTLHVGQVCEEQVQLRKWRRGGEVGCKTKEEGVKERCTLTFACSLSLSLFWATVINTGDGPPEKGRNRRRRRREKSELSFSFVASRRDYGKNSIQTEVKKHRVLWMFKKKERKIIRKPSTMYYSNALINSVFSILFLGKLHHEN